MAWSPQSPVRASHGQKSLSFELSPEISQAVGAPIVGYGLTTSPDYHGLLHSPHDYDMTEKIKAKKVVVEAMRGNAKLRQAVNELSMISATDLLGEATKKKQKLSGSRIAGRGTPSDRARSASVASDKQASSSQSSWNWLSDPKSTNPGSSTARSRRADDQGRDTPEDHDTDNESPIRRRKPRSASTSGSAGTRAGRGDRGIPSRSSTPRIPRNAAQMRTNRATSKHVIGKFAESTSSSKRSPSAPASSRPPALPLFAEQEHPLKQRGQTPTIVATPDESETEPLALVQERERARLAEKMLKHTEQEAEQLIMAISEKHRLEKQETEQRAYKTLEEHGAWTAAQIAESEHRARLQEQEAAEKVARTEREADEKCRGLRHRAEDIVRDLQGRMVAMEATAQTTGEKEQTEFKAELRKLKEEERNEEAQAEKLASRSEALKGEILPGT